MTPVATKAGKLLAKRLFGGSHEQMDYRSVRNLGCVVLFDHVQLLCASVLLLTAHYTLLFMLDDADSR